MAPWTESVGPRWTSYLTPKGYLILTVHLDPKALVTLDNLQWLQGISGELSIADGEEDMAVDAWMAFWTSP